MIDREKLYNFYDSDKTNYLMLVKEIEGDIDTYVQSLVTLDKGIRYGIHLWDEEKQDWVKAKIVRCED